MSAAITVWGVPVVDLLAAMQQPPPPPRLDLGNATAPSAGSSARDAAAPLMLPTAHGEAAFASLVASSMAALLNGAVPSWSDDNVSVPVAANPMASATASLGSFADAGAAAGAGGALASTVAALLGLAPGSVTVARVVLAPGAGQQAADAAAASPPPQTVVTAAPASPARRMLRTAPLAPATPASPLPAVASATLFVAGAPGGAQSAPSLLGAAMDALTLPSGGAPADVATGWQYHVVVSAANAADAASEAAVLGSDALLTLVSQKLRALMGGGGVTLELTRSVNVTSPLPSPPPPDGSARLGLVAMPPPSSIGVGSFAPPPPDGASSPPPRLPPPTPAAASASPATVRLSAAGLGAIIGCALLCCCLCCCFAVASYHRRRVRRLQRKARAALKYGAAAPLVVPVAGGAKAGTAGKASRPAPLSHLFGAGAPSGPGSPVMSAWGEGMDGGGVLLPATEGDGSILLSLGEGTPSYCLSPPVPTSPQPGTPRGKALVLSAARIGPDSFGALPEDHEDVDTVTARVAAASAAASRHHMHTGRWRDDDLSVGASVAELWRARRPGWGARELLEYAKALAKEDVEADAALQAAAAAMRSALGGDGERVAVEGATRGQSLASPA